MKIAFIARSTLHKVPGGDTVQVLQTAKHLEKLGVPVDIRLTNENINYGEYSLLHFFNLTRPADILYHISRTAVPYAVSPIYIDYSEYDRLHRKGLSGLALRKFSPSKQEYLKTICRWLMSRDALRSKQYIWMGQQRSIERILKGATMLLPNSKSESDSLEANFKFQSEYAIVPNGIDDQLFGVYSARERNSNLVICAARIEGVKNQLNLIKALNNSKYSLVLIGSPAPNQLSYYKECRRIAGKNIEFKEHIPQQELIQYYARAQVHALPSWFETCGLSSLEAAAMGCNITITEKGYTREYFGNHAFYCDPGDPESIYESINDAAISLAPVELQQRILTSFTWKETAVATLAAYNKIKYQ